MSEVHLLKEKVLPNNGKSFAERNVDFDDRRDAVEDFCRKEKVLSIKKFGLGRRSIACGSLIAPNQAYADGEFFDEESRERFRREKFGFNDRQKERRPCPRQNQSAC